ncbi:glycosyltransferase [Flavobacterium sp.]|uniref:glycosyltransferase n=1 Tax=Flavobacterium sp. TaxID=239 RepID=UPI003D133AE1
MNHQNIRIVQLIDSLEIGGAERMAVNYANGLVVIIGFSALITTRKEGLLKKALHPDVDFLFLNKRKKIDLQAIFKMVSYLKKNNITHIHAHSSSFFLALIAKVFMPSVKIIWHDHYGNSDYLNQRRSWILKIGSLGFDRIIAVNRKLELWAKTKLYCSQVCYLSNFVAVSDFGNPIKLFGNSGKRIVCSANLRPQKNHFFLLEVALLVKKKYPQWSFHLIGVDKDDSYSKSVKQQIKDLHLEQQVFIYGAVENVKAVLSDCQIGILTSKSEGLPLALLEYGCCQLPVVVTAVGQIPDFIDEGLGSCVDKEDVSVFFEKIEELIGNSDLREKIGAKFKLKVEDDFGVNMTLKKYIGFIKNGNNYNS